MDSSYQNIPFKLAEIEHEYGDKVHILANPYMNSILAKIGHPTTFQPTLNQYISITYLFLMEQMINYAFPRKNVCWDTRMKSFTERGEYKGQVLDPETRAIVVDLARAGTYPAHLIFDRLNYFFNPEGLRQDHFYLNRKVNDKNEVIGVDVSGSKIGGDQEDAFVVFPDPMGATGGSLSHCVTHYKNNVGGTAKKYLALHIIVTPEYIARMQSDHPDVEIFALRLDRGLSDQDVLDAVPGKSPDKERGLTDTQYIVPGAGGVGEVLNNSFV